MLRKMYGKLRQLIKNITYLCNNDVENQIANVRDMYQFDLAPQPMEKLEILNPMESIRTIMEKPKSIARLGDGELALIHGWSICFQEYSKELADRLLEVLSSRDENIYIGLPYFFFEDTSNLTGKTRNYVLEQASLWRRMMLKYASTSYRYIDTAFTQVFQAYQQYDFDEYYKSLRMLFQDKKLVIVCGESAISALEYDIFDVASQKDVIIAPSKNAFSDYQEILDKCLGVPKDSLLVLMLGPTATVLAYDLAQKGYTAWDIGHIAKDYDSYCRGKRDVIFDEK